MLFTISFYDAIYNIILRCYLSYNSTILFIVAIGDAANDYLGRRTSPSDAAANSCSDPSDTPSLALGTDSTGTTLPPF